MIVRKALIGATALLLTGAAIAAVQPKAGDFAAAVADPARPEADRLRDADRKPAEMLAFAGVQPGQKVAELAPGGGYFTRLLGDAVGAAGKVYAVSPRPSPSVDEWAKTHPNVVFRMITPGSPLAPEPVDLVWTTQNYHDFKGLKIGDGDAAAVFNAAAFQALKPGGTYLVGDHEAATGAGASQASTLHRIESAAVIREVESAGFKLSARSDILRNPADDHSLAAHDPAIRGKTDQFVLRFRKP